MQEFESRGEFWRWLLGRARPSLGWSFSPVRGEPDLEEERKEVAELNSSNFAWCVELDTVFERRGFALSIAARPPSTLTAIPRLPPRAAVLNCKHE